MMLVRSFVLCLMVGWVVIASPLSGFAQEPAGVEFTLAQETPIISYGENSVESKLIDPGAVFYYDGQFHMFANEVKGWPVTTSYTTYRTSSDGIHWTMVVDEPVMTNETIDYAPFGLLVSSVMVEPDGTWVLYYYTLFTSAWPATGGAIGRATAPAPTGPWTLSETPILEPGEQRAWDGKQVGHPYVVPVDDGYVMYFMGANRVREMRIGLATSPDGIAWTKYDDPATTDEAHVASDPVWEVDGVDIFAPKIVREGDEWFMLYGEPDYGYFLLTSPDGMQWTDYAGNPVWSVESEPGVPSIPVVPALAHFDDTYYLYMEVGSSWTNVYLATYTGNLSTTGPSE